MTPYVACRVKSWKVSVVYGSLLLIFVSECVQITVDILQLFRIFRSASYCYHVLTNMFEAFINLHRKMIIYRGELLRVSSGYVFELDTIKQIRVFGGFILQPEMKPPKIVPDPR